MKINDTHKLYIEHADNIFFTSDHHFGHENIIDFCNRPFSSVEEMDECMIDGWNETVNKSSTVFHLGDFTLNDIKYFRTIFSQLNGNIWFCTPSYHHDKRWIAGLEGLINDYSMFLPSLYCLTFDVGSKHSLKISLCHYPLDEWESSFHGSVHFHGHQHGNNVKKKNRIDVGVDCWDYKPVSLTTLLDNCELV